MLAAAQRLHTPTQFRQVIRRGTKAGRATLVLYLYRRSELDDVGRAGVSGSAAVGPPTAGTRCGFVVSKTVGGSVVRHLVTRRLRHLCAEALEDLPPRTDLVVRATPAAADASFAQLSSDFASALAKVTRRPAAPVVSA